MNFVQQSHHFVQDGGNCFDGDRMCCNFALVRCLILNSVEYEKDDDCLLYAAWFRHSICTVNGVSECRGPSQIVYSKHGVWIVSSG